jgi:ribosomal protein S18 acetylase RimI-like enzyme
MNIRRMTPDDLDFAFGLVQAEGWRGQTRLSFEDFLAHDPDGCFIVEADGQAAGMCVATRYRQNGFIGELIVTPGQRGRGLGSAIFAHAVRYLQNAGITNLYLDGDAPGIPIYEKAGFRKVCLSRRFNGQVSGGEALQVHPAAPANLSMILRVDRALFGDDRSFFLRRRFERHPELCFVAEEGRQVLGYIMAHPADGVVNVGPWAALPGLPARLLLERLALAVPGAGLRIGALDSNPRAIDLLRSLPGLQEDTPCWRMALGPQETLGSSGWLYATGSPAAG